MAVSDTILEVTSLGAPGTESQQQCRLVIIYWAKYVQSREKGFLGSKYIYWCDWEAWAENILHYFKLYLLLDFLLGTSLITGSKRYNWRKKIGWTYSHSNDFGQHTVVYTLTYHPLKSWQHWPGCMGQYPLWSEQQQRFGIHRNSVGLCICMCVVQQMPVHNANINPC